MKAADWCLVSGGWEKAEMKDQAVDSNMDLKGAAGPHTPKLQIF